MIAQEKVLIVEDEENERSGLAELISAWGYRTDTARDGLEGLEKVAAWSPGIVVTDFKMPRMDGIEAAGRMATDSPQTRVVILTTYDLDEYVYSALRAGASGFLLKSTQPSELLTAIRVVAAGDALLAPSVTRRLVAEFVRRPVPAGTPGDGQNASLGTITAREREVLALIATGLSNAEIADHLAISPATTKTHVGHLLTKLHARDRVHLVILAYQAGVVPAG